MKKLLEKDKKLRLHILKTETLYKILKLIFKNLNFSILIRWNAFIMLNNIFFNRSYVWLSNRCVYTVNKKRYNKRTKVSRQTFLKYIRFSQIYGVNKSSW